MYAHQVIEEIKKRYGQNPFFPPHLLERIILAIRISQKFHFGNSYGLDRFYRAKKGELAFREMAQYLKFPYRTCWFDYRIFDESSSNPFNASRGFLILLEKTNEKRFDVYSFLKAPGYLWGMSDIVQTIEIGEGRATRIVISASMNVGSEFDKDYWLDCDISLIQRSVLLLNCKNIIIEKIQAPTALNKKRKRLGKQELFDYHVLNVTIPSKKEIYQEKTEPLSHNRLHLCRGHFKEYTVQHPLFGRFIGIYWWQAHVRGQNKKGIVIKDYQIQSETKSCGNSQSTTESSPTTLIPSS